MISFTFKVKNQKLECSYDGIVADSINYLDAVFLFSEEWNGLQKYAHFANGDKKYEMIIIDDEIRAERGLNLTEGIWKVNLHGSILEDGEIKTRITTNEVQIYVEKSGVMDGDPFPDVIPSIGEQIVSEATQAAEDAKLYRNEAKQSENGADDSADIATEKATIATEKAAEATQAAESAKAVASGLPERVSEYISDHKEELKGEPGYTPIKGIDYFDGEPGEPGKEYDDTELREEIASQNENLAKHQTEIDGLDTRVSRIEEGGGDVGVDPVAREGVSRLSESITEISEEVKSKNLLDKSKATLTPYNYINPNGVTETYGNNFVTDYIPVEVGKVVTISGYTPSGFVKRSYASICLFDSDKNVKSGGNYNKDNYTVQSGVAFVRLTLNKSYCYDVDGMVELTTDGNPTTYEPYFDSRKKLADSIIESSGLATVEYVDNKKFTLASMTENIGCSLPISEYFMSVGIPESWYSESFVTPKGFCVNMYSGSEADRYSDRYSFANNRAYYGNNAYSWHLYDSLLNLVKKEVNTGYGYARNCKALNLQNCSLLCIGDSTVDHDVMTSKIKSFFAENGKTITLLGTLGDGIGNGNNNEGRAGWTTSDYFTNKQYNGAVNPFYNPSTQTFDFSYYMQNQGYASVDFVAIQLGINDLYNFDDTIIIPTWDNVKAMIDSIHLFDQSIKVLLNLPTTPNADQSKHTVFEPLYRSRVIRYCDYAITKAKELYPTTKVRVSYNHLILNPNTDIRDNVHPTNDGYEKMGLEVCNQINCWQNGY